MIDTLLAAGAAINARDEYAETLLRVAARHNENPALIEALAAAGADLDARDRDGETPLHYAAEHNESPAVIEALVAAGADLDARDEDGETPLHYAAGRENPALIAVLLLAGADASVRNADGRRPIDIASENDAIRDSGVYRYLAENSQPDCSQWNTSEFFRFAIEQRVAECLSAGADINFRDEDGGTPLHYAAEHNENPAVIEALIAAGADLDARGEYGWTPLHVAASENESPAVIAVLLLAGADASVRDAYGRRPADRANLTIRDSDVYRDLDRLGPPDCPRWNTLEYFRFATEPEVAACLSAGADINSWDESGRTPLHYAAGHNENPALIEALLAAGADLNAWDEKGPTPLHYAAGHSEKPAMIEALVAGGADRNARTRKAGLRCIKRPGSTRIRR